MGGLLPPPFACVGDGWRRRGGGALFEPREEREKGKGDTEKLSGNENPPAPTSTASLISPSSDQTEPFGDFFRRSIGRRLGKLAIISVANVG